VTRIFLVRHGRSAHVHSGWIDLAGFHRWRESYEAAAIVDGETPPAALVEIAASAHAIAASNAPRAIASAKLLREDVRVSPLLRELDLHPPNLRGVKMPLVFWALTFAFRRSLATPAEETRAREAAAWLAELAREHGPVIAVTHHSFRLVLAQTLIRDGWRSDGSPGRSHWSVWSLWSAEATPPLCERMPRA